MCETDNKRFEKQNWQHLCTYLSYPAGYKQIDFVNMPDFVNIRLSSSTFWKGRYIFHENKTEKYARKEKKYALIRYGSENQLKIECFYHPKLVVNNT